MHEGLQTARERERRVEEEVDGGKKSFVFI